MRYDGPSGESEELKSGKVIDDEKQVQPLSYDKLFDIIEGMFSGDEDVDGVPNWRDELSGTNDNVDTIHLTDGTVVAEVGDNIWALFDSNGNQYDGFLSRTLTGMTSGSQSQGMEVTLPPGIAYVVTYSGPEGIYSFQPTAYGEPEILVEGSY